MLINFTFSNFRSFRDKAEFSMIAGKGLLDRATLQRMPGFRSMNVLPISAIFGGNASGKSNFVKALYHLQQMVLSGKIETDTFKLDSVLCNAPSTFVVCALADERVWEYTLSVNNKEIEEESLIYVKDKKEVQVFYRTRDTFSIDKSVDIPQDGRKKLELIGESLAPSSIFLHSVQTYRIAGIDSVMFPIYDWFQNTLCIVSADSRRAALGVDLIRRLELYSDALSNADTGIDELKLTKVNIEQLDISSDELEKFKQSEAKVIFNKEDSTLVLIKAEDGIHAYRCLSMHHDDNGNEVPFLFTDESDGTRRLLHLLPTLIDYEVKPRVYVVDELDRSLHTNLSRYLVEQQLKIARTEARNRQQLIFTTHDVMLMDQTLLRRDEMWAVERGRDKGSHLISFEDFIEIRKDKDIRRSYLTGHMGGLPRLAQ
ncbi:MAG: ATP-binding protein [Akkermansia sp.]|nr:ATP-binding protein [Akkermansia sp.]